MSLEIRDLNLNDLVKLESRAKFPMPNLSNRRYFIKKALDFNNELAAIFWVKATTEMSLIIEENLPNFKKAIILKKLNEFVEPEVKRYDFDDMHLFIQDDSHYVDILTKHLQFEKVSGQALYRRS